jgi:putative spermidine/putrescine transport system permease protein
MPWLLLAAAPILAFLLAPLLAALVMSLAPTETLTLAPSRLSLRWYAEFFSNPRWIQATINSLIVGGGATLVATLLGTAAAIGLHFGRFPAQGLLLSILTLPVVTPFIVTGAALFFAFSAVGLGGSLVGLVLGHSVIASPFVVVTVLAALQGQDANLLRAASSLGASPLLALRRVVLPLIRPGVAAGAVFAFATSLDEFIISLFLAGPGQFTLPRQMYATVREYTTPTIMAAATLLVALSVLFVLATEALRRRPA